MVEWVSLKRMIFIFIFLGGLTIFFLIVENYLASDKKNVSTVFNETNLTNEFCWLHENYEIVHDCESCTDFDRTYGNNEACKSRYKQVIKCELSGLTYRSCDAVNWSKEKKFWIFHLFMVVASIVCSIVVYLRQKILDRRTFIRLQNNPFS